MLCPGFEGCPALVGCRSTPRLPGLSTCPAPPLTMQTGRREQYGPTDKEVCETIRRLL